MEIAGIGGPQDRMNVTYAGLKAGPQTTSEWTYQPWGGIGTNKGTRLQEHADSLENLVPFGKPPSYTNLSYFN
jgi:hypothetical protein